MITTKQLNEMKAQGDVQVVNFLDILRNGYRFTFEEQGMEIKCWGSAFTGKEKVLLNGNLVSELRTVTKRQTVHNFKVGDSTYEVELTVVSMLTGELHCVLIKDGVHVETKKLIQAQSIDRQPYGWKRFAKDVIVYGSIGAVVGVLFAKYEKHGETPIDVVNNIVQYFFG